MVVIYIIFNVKVNGNFWTRLTMIVFFCTAEKLIRYSRQGEVRKLKHEAA